MTAELPIVLFTDFGPTGPYVGQVHLAIHRLAAAVRVIDLQHDAPAFRPALAGYLLAAQLPYLPKAAVVIAVVDPGVGTERAGLIVRLGQRYFVGPDNGLFGPLLADADEVQRIDWQPQESSLTFHGRDWFAPVGVGLAVGRPLAASDVDPAACVGYGAPEQLAKIIYQDAYGNLMTGISLGSPDKLPKLQVDGQPLPAYRTFAEARVGEAFCYRNALGLLELAVNQGSAAAQLGLQPGDPLDITFA